MSFLGGILIINLDRRPDRLEAITADLAKSDLSGIPVYRMPAVDASKVSLVHLTTPRARAELAALEKSRIRDYHAQLTPGALGCYMSHLAAWEYAASSDKPVLIFEDDATISKEVREFIDWSYEDALAWDKDHRAKNGGKFMPWILSLHCWCQRACALHDDNFLHPDTYWGMSGYILTPQSAQALMAMKDTEMLPMDLQVDSKLSQLVMEKKLKVMVRQITQPRNAGTDIQYRTIARAPLFRKHSLLNGLDSTGVFGADDDEDTMYVVVKQPKKCSIM